MTWAQVEAALHFWTPAEPWGGTGQGIGGFTAMANAVLGKTLRMRNIRADRYFTGLRD